MKQRKYKTEAEQFGWSFVFEDFVPEALKKKVTQKLEVTPSFRDVQESFSGFDL